MSTTVRSLQPADLWNYFADLNAVPRPSKKEERVIQFMVDFGKSLGLPTRVDEIGNVIITKPPSPGMENRLTIALQSHLDMVHQKNAGTEFDFEQEGIRMQVDGDWVKAEGTTLGADNGIGVATIMALLASKDIQHPSLEALFTIDEETGMTGAMGLKGGLLQADILLNLDTEDDDELTIGCAGGIDITAKGSYEMVSLTGDWQGYTLHIQGLTGGHSGMDIHRGRGNANKLINRLLMGATQAVGLRLIAIDGGGLRNAIPRESSAQIAIPASQASTFEAWIHTYSETLASEYGSTDPDLEIVATQQQAAESAMDESSQLALLRAIYACPNGIYRMSPDIEGLVQTSNNLARVEVANGAYQILCLTRSAVDSEKKDLEAAIMATFELAGAEVTADGAYPGWAPRPDATIVQLMSSLYQESFSESAQVGACHAGLECGILGANYPDMEMISFGPNIRGAHSPDEKVQISSVQKFWGFLLDTLTRIPESASVAGR